jgi:outer membrane biosynthesis protein TonB
MYVKLVTLSITAKVGENYVKSGMEVELAPTEFNDGFVKKLIGDVQQMIVDASPSDEEAPAPTSKPAAKPAPKPAPKVEVEEDDAQPETTPAEVPDRRALRGAQKETPAPTAAKPAGKPAPKPSAKPAAKKSVAITYDRNNDGHKKLLGELLDERLGAENWRPKGSPQKEAATNASKELAGVDFLDDAGTVLPEFLAALDAHIGATESEGEGL